ncbi:hypothetical protein HA402_002716 [Bradysia odoriphaga]|nr:hypothetical protein HA402_002716 [Bradysia odoriphaga]
MDQDKNKKVFRLPRIQMSISAETRQNIMQACSNVVATPEELEANILVPFPECQRRLREMAGAAQSKDDMKQIISGPSEWTEDVKGMLALLGEPTEDVAEIPASGGPMAGLTEPFSKLKELWSNERAIKCKDIEPRFEEMKAAFLNRSCQVELPSSTPIPQLGRPVPKTNIPASVNTTRKPQSDDMQTADKGLTNEGTEPMCNDIFVIEDGEVLGEVQMKDN